MVVLIQLVLLPRFNLKADPDYDPSDDWAVSEKTHRTYYKPM
jgi:hypothetical protein